MENLDILKPLNAEIKKIEPRDGILENVKAECRALQNAKVKSESKGEKVLNKTQKAPHARWLRFVALPIACVLICGVVIGGYFLFIGGSDGFVNLHGLTISGIANYQSIGTGARNESEAAITPTSFAKGVQATSQSSGSTQGRRGRNTRIIGQRNNGEVEEVKFKNEKGDTVEQTKHIQILAAAFFDEFIFIHTVSGPEYEGKSVTERYVFGIQDDGAFTQWGPELWGLPSKETDVFRSYAISVRTGEIVNINTEYLCIESFSWDDTRCMQSDGFVYYKGVDFNPYRTDLLRVGHDENNKIINEKIEIKGLETGEKFNPFEVDIHGNAFGLVFSPTNESAPDGSYAYMKQNGDLVKGERFFVRAINGQLYEHDVNYYALPNDNNDRTQLFTDFQFALNATSNRYLNSAGEIVTGDTFNIMPLRSRDFIASENGYDYYCYGARANGGYTKANVVRVNRSTLQIEQVWYKPEQISSVDLTPCSVTKKLYFTENVNDGSHTMIIRAYDMLTGEISDIPTPATKLCWGSRLFRTIDGAVGGCFTFFDDTGSSTMPMPWTWTVTADGTWIEYNPIFEIDGLINRIPQV